MQQIQTQLHNLRLSGIAEALQQQREQPNTYADLSFEERLALLVAAEVTYRDDRRLVRLLRAAKLKLAATMSEIDYQHPRGLKQNVMAGLAAGDWLVPLSEFADHRTLWLRQKLYCLRSGSSCLFARARGALLQNQAVTGCDEHRESRWQLHTTAQSAGENGTINFGRFWIRTTKTNSTQ